MQLRVIRLPVGLSATDEVINVQVGRCSSGGRHTFVSRILGRLLR